MAGFTGWQCQSPCLPGGKNATRYENGVPVEDGYLASCGSCPGQATSSGGGTVGDAARAGLPAGASFANTAGQFRGQTSAERGLPGGYTWDGGSWVPSGQYNPTFTKPPPASDPASSAYQPPPPAACPSASEGAVLLGPDRTMYLVQNGRRRRIPDMPTFESLGVPRANVIDESGACLGAIPEGAPLSAVQSSQPPPQQQPSQQPGAVPGVPVPGIGNQPKVDPKVKIGAVDPTTDPLGWVQQNPVIAAAAAGGALLLAMSLGGGRRK